MPERRQHRGPHPDDRKLFAPPHHGRLRAAVGDLSWLLTRGYAEPSALKLVGDRHALTERQRIAVRRCACSDQALAHRRANEVAPPRIVGEPMLIDAFNVITTVEAALAGGVLLLARDGCLRDMASMHGSYRKVQETGPALERIGEVMARCELGPARWLIDSPVSNSGRLKAAVEAVAREHGWAWTGEVVPDPDPLLAAAREPIATADSVVLDRCQRWINLGRHVVERTLPDACVVDLSDRPGHAG